MCKHRSSRAAHADFFRCQLYHKNSQINEPGLCAAVWIPLGEPNRVKSTLWSKSDSVTSRRMYLLPLRCGCGASSLFVVFFTASKVLCPLATHSRRAHQLRTLIRRRTYFLPSSDDDYMVNTCSQSSLHLVQHAFMSAAIRSGRPQCTWDTNAPARIRTGTGRRSTAKTRWVGSLLLPVL